MEKMIAMSATEANVHLLIGFNMAQMYEIIRFTTDKKSYFRIYFSKIRNNLIINNETQIPVQIHGSGRNSVNSRFSINPSFHASARSQNYRQKSSAPDKPDVFGIPLHFVASFTVTITSLSQWLISECQRHKKATDNSAASSVFSIVTFALIH
jgi:hypothetical protein